jgi:ABC-type sugar transport system substrate-binding protein
MERRIQAAAVIVIIAVATIGAVVYWYTLPQAPAKIKIAFSGWTGVAIPYWVAYWKGMQDAAAHFGDVDLSLYDAEQSPTNQLNHISDMISLGIDAVCIVTVWPDTLTEGALLAKEAGMAFISIDVEVSGETLYTGSDMVLGSYRVTKAMIEKIGGSGNIAHICGTLSDSVSIMRWNGFLQAAAEYENITVLDVKPGYYSRATAYDQTEAWIATFPVIDGIFTACDDMTLGAYEALVAAGRENDTCLTGYDAIEEYLTAIEDGKVYATVSGDPYILGWLGVYYGRQYALGEDLPRKHMVHSPLILPENVTSYLSYVNDQMDDNGMTWEDVQTQMAKATLFW